MSRRALRTMLGRVLPESVKGPLRGRLFGYRAARVELGFALREEDGAPRVTVDGLELALPAGGRDDALYHFRDNGASVEEIAGFLRAAREVGGTLLDVGAARGLFAALFCAARPGNRAFAYEPSPVMADDADALAAMNGLEPRLRVLRAAVGAAPARLPAAVDATGLIDLAPARGELEVEMVTLDDECARLGLDPDVVKIDVEGHEYDVLLGARALLARRRPLLFVELHLDLMERAGKSPRAVVDFLASRGYRFETSLGRPLSASAVRGAAEAVLRFVAR